MSPKKVTEQWAFPREWEPNIFCFFATKTEVHKNWTWITVAWMILFAISQANQRIDGDSAIITVNSCQGYCVLRQEFPTDY